MRIIAGSLKSREFKSPNGHRTHPMSDKVRGALFNKLGDLSGLTVLDPFGGSGALSFEAISRGAETALIVEHDKTAQRVIQENILSLNLKQQVKLVKAGANSWLSTTDSQFDIVLIDPPYDDLQPTLIAKLSERLKIGGLTVISLPPKNNLALDSRFQLIDSSEYGDATLAFYRRIS